MTSPSCVYDPLEDSEFDETDSGEEEEQDETDNDEEEQEQEQGEEEWDDSERDEFKDVEEHNNADDQHVGTLTSIHNDSDPLFDNIPEEDKDLTQSPAAAALARIEIRNGKRPLRATDDLRTAFGSSMNIQRSTISTLDARSNTRLSRLIQPALEGQSNHFTEPSPFQAPAWPDSQQPASSQRPGSLATPCALQHPGSLQLPGCSQPSNSSASLVEPTLAVDSTTPASKRPRQRYSRTVSAPDLLKTMGDPLAMPGLPSVPGSPGLPFSPRQKVAAYENQQALIQPASSPHPQPPFQAPPSPAPSFVSLQSPFRTQTSLPSPSPSIARRTPVPPNCAPSFSSPLAAYFQSPAPVAVRNPTWEALYTALPLGTVPEPSICSIAPQGQELLALVPIRKSTQKRAVHGHFFGKIPGNELYVTCRVIVQKTKETHGKDSAGTRIATGAVVVEACGKKLQADGSSHRRITHIELDHNDIYKAILAFRGFQELIQAKGLADQWQQILVDTKTAPNATYNGVREDILKTIQAPTQSEQDQFVDFLLSLVTKQGVSYATLDSVIFKGMIALINPAYRIPGMVTLQRILSDKVNTWRTGMVTYIQHHVYRSAITMDSWTTSTGDRKFLGVTLHFMDADYKMRTLAIGMALMVKPQCGEYLCGEVEKIVNEWRLGGRLISMTTDGAFNMRKCVEEYKKKQSPEQEVSWVRCGAHAIQLCINSALSKQKDDDPKSANAMFKRCERIVAFFNGCGAAKKALEHEQISRGNKVYKLIRSTETRWNSRLTLGLRVLKLAEEIEDAVGSIVESSVKADADKAKEIKPLLLNPQELQDFQDVCDVLKPAADLTHFIGASKYPTISSVYAKVDGLVPPLGPLVTETARALHQDLELQIKSRFPSSEIPNATLVAMFLNPGCFSTELFTAPSEYLDKAKGLTRRALLTLARETDGQPASVSVPVPAPVVAGGALARLRNTTYMYRAEQELARYAQTVFEDPAGFGDYLDTPHAFWKEVQSDLPLLARLFCAYHCVQATSSESERLFSKAGLLLSARKSSLSSSNFFNMLMHSSYEKFRESYIAA